VYTYPKLKVYEEYEIPDPRLKMIFQHKALLELEDTTSEILFEGSVPRNLKNVTVAKQ